MLYNNTLYINLICIYIQCYFADNNNIIYVQKRELYICDDFVPIAQIQRPSINSYYRQSR